jgi:hypothetical protein
MHQFMRYFDLLVMHRLWVIDRCARLSDYEPVANRGLFINRIASKAALTHKPGKSQALD